MSDPFPYPERPIDAEACGVDALHQRVAADTVSPLRRRRRWLLTAAIALAASILFAVFLLIAGSPVQASPRNVVERARNVHQVPTDRCYSVKVAVPLEVRRQFPRFDFDRDSRLWTRGDRYFVELPGDNGVWGRDEQNRVWFVPTPDAGARFDDNEVPAVFREFLNVRAVRLDELLDEVLAECELTWATNVDVPSDVRRVYAIGRNDERWLRHAIIDVDKETNVIQRLALDRQLFRDPRAKVSVTFMLIDTSAQDISRYSAEGHLKPGAPIHDRRHPAVRMGLMLRHLGPFKED
jgi:hypothetical protein